MEISTYRDLLTDWFTTANREFFNFKLQPSSIVFGTPSSTKEFGQYSDGKIVIRKSLITGSHPQLQPGTEHEAGLLLFLKDIVLHSMIHQAMDHLEGVHEQNYDGHGSKFRTKCNEIGRTMNLPAVRSSKCHKKVRGLISCAAWPWGVRPPNYYMGAFTPRIPTRRPSAVAGIVERIEDLSLDEKRELRMLLANKKLL